MDLSSRQLNFGPIAHRDQDIFFDVCLQESARHLLQLYKRLRKLEPETGVQKQLEPSWRSWPEIGVNEARPICQIDTGGYGNVKFIPDASCITCQLVQLCRIMREEMGLSYQRFLLTLSIQFHHLIIVPILGEEH